MSITRQKYYIVSYGDSVYSEVYTKFEDAENRRDQLLKDGHKVKIKIGYRA